MNKLTQECLTILSVSDQSQPRPILKQNSIRGFNTFFCLSQSSLIDINLLAVDFVFSFCTVIDTVASLTRFQQFSVSTLELVMSPRCLMRGILYCVSTWKIQNKNLSSIPWTTHLWILARSPLVDVRYAAHVLVKEATWKRTVPAA